MSLNILDPIKLAQCPCTQGNQMLTTTTGVVGLEITGPEFRVKDMAKFLEKSCLPGPIHLSLTSNPLLHIT